MSMLSSSWLTLMKDPAALLETTVIVGIVSLAMVGFLFGLKELASDIRRFRKIKA
tara:strand:+ start:75 stop:239 length:165 start_codon:yes stop_codon:yes gene_type:complete